MTTKTTKFHYIRTFRQDRTGRALRVRDSHAKKYHLAICGRELTDAAMKAQSDIGPEHDCGACVRILDSAGY
jgi:hypothetical protein